MPLQMVRWIPTGVRCDAIPDPTDESLLARGGVEAALRKAVEDGCRCVTIPLIAAAGAAPGDRGLKFLCGVIDAFLAEHELLVYLVISDQSAYRFDGALRREVSAFIDDCYVGIYYPLYYLLCGRGLIYRHLTNRAKRRKREILTKCSTVQNNYFHNILQFFYCLIK